MIALLYFARDFFIPLLVGIMLAYVLRRSVDLMVGAKVPRGSPPCVVVLTAGSAPRPGDLLALRRRGRAPRDAAQGRARVRVSLQDAVPGSSPPRSTRDARSRARARQGRGRGLRAGRPSAPSQQATGPTLATRLQEYMVAQGLAIIFTPRPGALRLLLTWFRAERGRHLQAKLLKMVGPRSRRKKITVRILDDIDTPDAAPDGRDVHAQRC